MNIQEFRIGNLLYLKKKVCTISGILNDGDVPELLFKEDLKQCYWSEIEPIPLTKKWLLIFGFEYRKYSNGEEYKLDSFSIYCNDTDLSTYIFESPDYEFSVCVNYVHQLQNLFHSIIGKELKKQTT